MCPILNNIIKTMCFYMLTQTHEREARGGGRGQTPPSLGFILNIFFNKLVTTYY